MHLFPQDNDLKLYETGFEDDILGRKHMSNELTALIHRIESPIVLALDDKWGTGKSYFLKRWVAEYSQPESDGGVAVYFDAFENDYLSDPLVSIVMAVTDRFPKTSSKTLGKWTKAAKALIKPTLKVGLSVASFGATNHLGDAGDAVVEAVNGQATTAVDKLWSEEEDRKDAVRAFKDTLTELTKESSAPLVIVVDELDRCRPDYALQVLEVIKHFFAVPKVHFVLGVNSEALENSVKARYGAGIDAKGYLKKFINVSFSLPRQVPAEENATVVSVYSKKLADEMSLPQKMAGRCIDLLKYVAAENEVSLRDVGKIMSNMALLPSEALENNRLPGWVDVACVLLVSSVIAPDFHRKFVANQATEEDVREFLGATKQKTERDPSNQHNSEFSHSLSIWYKTTLFCASPKSYRSLPWEDDKALQIAKRFDHFGGIEDDAKIPERLQKEWIDLFRL